MKGLVYSTGCALFLVFFVWINLAKAQEKNTLHTLDTITVTAQKQEENAQEVPLSISVFNDQNLDDLNIDSVSEIADFVPNLSIFFNGASGMNSPSTRGIHAFVESMTVSSGLYVDGVPILSASGYEDTLLDIERVEVLRGPQGTLYGKNTETGVINIITKQPDNNFRGKISAEGGEDEKIQGTFNVSGPIMQDKLFFGLAGKYYDKDGFIENSLTGDTVDDRNHWYGKGQLRWTPVEDLDISLIFARLEYDDGANNMGLTEDGSAMFGLPSLDNRETATDVGYNKSEVNSQILKVGYSFSDTFKLTSITTNRVYDDVRFADWDFTELKIMETTVDSRYNKLAQELRLDSSTDKLKWLLGIYYDRDDNDINTKVDSDSPAFQSTSDRDIDGDGYAVFGQASYSFGEKLSITAGLRYEEQEVDFTDHVAGIRENETWNEVSPKITLDYLIAPEIMTYASVSKGYRSGGFNTYATDPQYMTYDEEKLWSYEIGMKSTILNQRIIVNGALFYMDIKDMQVNEAVSAYESYLTNAAEASAIGGEIDITARLTESLSLNASLGYTNIEFDKYEDALGDYEGNKNPYAPEYTFNIGAQYRNSQGLYVRCDLIGYGETYLDKENKYSRDPYKVVNAKIGYEMEDLDIYAYAKNLFDEKYDTVGIFDGLYTVYSEPREVGIKLTYRL